MSLHGLVGPHGGKDEVLHPMAAQADDTGDNALFLSSLNAQ